jgi:hypothetical protein
MLLHTRSRELLSASQWPLVVVKGHHGCTNDAPETTTRGQRPGLTAARVPGQPSTARATWKHTSHLLRISKQPCLRNVEHQLLAKQLAQQKHSSGCVCGGGANRHTDHRAACSPNTC